MLIQRLQGPYEKQLGIYYEFDLHSQPLGAGGMGKVFKGEKIVITTGARIPVAIKAMYDDLPDHVIERARREASIQLRNDNLVEMHGFVETIDTTKYGEQIHHYHVISEFLNGVMLNDLLCGIVTDKEGCVIPFAKELYEEYEKDHITSAIRIIKRILSGIMALHDKGYIHRDIDPTNIMVTDKGNIKLIDFGIAKKMSSLGSQDKLLTSTGAFIGKAHYAAPELVTGDIAHQNFSTDIYAIGVLFYQLITGKLPFTGPTHIILNAQLHTKTPLKDIPNSECKKIIGIATAKNQDDRYVSASAFRVAIDAIKNKSKKREKPEKKQRVPKEKTDKNKIAVFNKHNTKVFSLAFVAVLFVVGCVIVIQNWDKIFPNLDKAIAMLYSQNDEDVRKGWDVVNNYADRNHSMALYELGVSYSTSKNMADIANKRQLILNIEGDNTKSHEYLKKAIASNPENYKALFALADDCYFNRELNDQDKQFRFHLYEETLKYAEKVNDQEYVKKCKEVINNYPTSLDKSIAMLYSQNDEDVRKGWDVVNNYADSNHSMALYELGVSYSTSKKMADIATERCRMLNIKGDNAKSHEYLKKAIESDSENYKALFALADDFYFKRGLTNQDEQFCKPYLNTDDAQRIFKKNGESSNYNSTRASFILYVEALKYAEKVNDQEYVQKCKEVIKNFEIYNLRYYK